MNAIADNIRTAILTLLWDDGPVDGRRPADRRPSGAVPGKFGNAVRLGGQPRSTHAAGRASSPALNDFTVSAWVNPAATTTWSRVFDFGTGTTANMFLTVSAGGAGSALRDHDRRRRRRAADQRTTAASCRSTSGSHVAVTRRGNDRHAVYQRRRRRPPTRT